MSKENAVFRLTSCECAGPGPRVLPAIPAVRGLLRGCRVLEPAVPLRNAGLLSPRADATRDGGRLQRRRRQAPGCSAQRLDSATVHRRRCLRVLAGATGHQLRYTQHECNIALQCTFYNSFYQAYEGSPGSTRPDILITGLLCERQKRSKAPTSYRLRFEDVTLFIVCLTAINGENSQ